MRNLVTGSLFLLALGSAMSVQAQGVNPEYPKIRAVTAFVNVDKDSYAVQIDGTAQFLKTAQRAFNGAGFGGAGGRLTTQPFPRYIKGLKRDEALALLKAMSAVAQKDNVRLNIGPAMMYDDDPTDAAELLPAALADGKIYANLIVADDKGIHWRAIVTAAHVIHELSVTSTNGNSNFMFAAGA